MTKKDYYDILGVQKGATKEEIKKVYKRLAKQYHPDLNPNKPEAEKKFKEINEAVAVLADEEKRRHYDQYGTADFGEAYEGFDSSAFRGFGFNDFFSDFDTIFDQFFGGGRRSARRGPDFIQEVEIDLEDIAHETTQTIPINKLEVCESCHGAGGDRTECAQCHGSGRFSRTQRTPFGVFQTSTACHECRGAGSTITKSCHKCHGEGRLRIRKDVEVTIPAGIDDGTRLRLRGEGGLSESGGEPGDLYILIRIKEHQLFQRKDNDIYLAVPISYTQAILGDEVEVPILGGKASLTIPPYTQDNTSFRMRGKGLHSARGSVGDQLVKVIIKIPEKLSRREHELIEELAELEKEKPTSFLSRFFK